MMTWDHGMKVHVRATCQSLFITLMAWRSIWFQIPSVWFQDYKFFQGNQKRTPKYWDKDYFDNLIEIYLA